MQRILKSYFIRRNNTRAKTTGIAFIQSFPTDLPESWKPFSILHVFFPSLSPSHEAEGLFAWERSRNCGRFSSFSSRPFIRKPRRCDQLCRLAIIAAAFAILWDFYVRFLFLRFSYSLCRQILLESIGRIHACCNPQNPSSSHSKIKKAMKMSCIPLSNSKRWLVNIHKHNKLENYMC